MTESVTITAKSHARSLNSYFDLIKFEFVTAADGTATGTTPNYHIAATSGTEYADSIFITQVGVHIEEDALGSRTEGTK